MNKKEFFDYIESLSNHIFFLYNGIECGIEPISKYRFEISFNGKLFIANSIDEVKNGKYFDGKSLSEIFDDITDIEY